MSPLTRSSPPLVRSTFLLLLGLVWSGSCLAQAETTLGSSDAERCYQQTLFMPGTGDVDICTKALEDDDLDLHDRAATYSNRGILYSQYKEYHKALADHDKAIELMPSLGKAYINRGNVYFHLKEYDKALADYDKAIELKAQPLVTCWYNKGLTLIELRRKVEARAALQQALKLAPNSLVIQEKLAGLGEP